MATICIFGDSITWGSFDPEGGGWVTRLRNSYEAEGLPVGQATNVYNLGVDGDNTDDLLKRFDTEAGARKPSTIIFAIGINDSAFVISKDDNLIPLTQFNKNLNTLLNKAKTFTPKIAFIGLTVIDESRTVPVPWSIDEAYTQENKNTYNDLIKEFCKQNNLPFFDTETVVALQELTDGVHPNSLGHQKMFEAVKSFIERESLL